MHDQSLGIIGVGLQAVLEVLLADEKALRVPPAVPTHNNEVGGEELSHRVEDAATAVGTGYEEEKRTLRAECLIVENSARNSELGHSYCRRRRIRAKKDEVIERALRAFLPSRGVSVPDSGQSVHDIPHLRQTELISPKCRG